MDTHTLHPLVHMLPDLVLRGFLNLKPIPIGIRHKVLSIVKCKYHDTWFIKQVVGEEAIFNKAYFHIIQSILH